MATQKQKTKTTAEVEAKSTAVAKPEDAAAPTALQPIEKLDKKLIREMTIEELQQYARSVLERSEIIRSTAAAIAESEWGQRLSPHFRASLARYCLLLNLDPARHVYVLGGRIYVNAEAYMDLMAIHPDFEKMTVEPVMDDERLEAEERAERRAARAALGIPEQALGAFIVKIWKKTTPEPFVGWNFAGGGSRKNDPVGDQHPVLTAQTRAIRRAARQAFSIWGARVADLFARAESELAIERETQPKVEGTLPTGRPVPWTRDPYEEAAQAEAEPGSGGPENGPSAAQGELSIPDDASP